MIATRAAALLIRWLVLLTSGLAMLLPPAIAEACDPAQCIDEAVHASHDLSRSRGATDGSQPEHDCDGPFHVCHCCAHAQGVSQRLSFRIAAPGRELASRVGIAEDRALTGYRPRLYRPPTA